MKKVNVNCLIMFLRFINIFIELCFLVGVLTIDFIVFLGAAEKLGVFMTALLAKVLMLCPPVGFVAPAIDSHIAG